MGIYSFKKLRCLPIPRERRRSKLLTFSFLKFVKYDGRHADFEDVLGTVFVNPDAADPDVHMAVLLQEAQTDEHGEYLSCNRCDGSTTDSHCRQTEIAEYQNRVEDDVEYRLYLENYIRRLNNKTKEKTN